MKLMHGGAAGSLVVAVHVLRYDNQVRLLLQIHQCAVGGVGLAVGDELPTPVVPLPDQLGVRVKCARGGQLFGAILAPEGIFPAAEGGDAAGGRNARAGEHGDFGVGGDGLAVFFQVHENSLLPGIILDTPTSQEFLVQRIVGFLIFLPFMLGPGVTRAHDHPRGPAVVFNVDGPGAREIAEQCLDAWHDQGDAIAAALDPRGAATDTITCLVLNAESFAANFTGRLPDWGVGVALPGGRFIALNYTRLPAVGRGASEVFLHEMVHAILFQVTGRTWLPTWLHEGTAMLYSGEWKFRDTVSLVLDGQVPSLDRLGGRFPAPAALADRAYRTSLLAVDRLQDQYGDDVVGEILAETARLENFPAGFAEATGESLEVFVRGFSRSMNFRLGWAVMLTRWPTLFVLMSLIFAFGAGRKMWLNRRRLAEMEDKEDDNPL